MLVLGQERGELLWGRFAQAEFLSERVGAEVGLDHELTPGAVLPDDLGAFDGPGQLDVLGVECFLHCAQDDRCSR